MIYEYKRLAPYKIQLQLTNSWLTRRWDDHGHRCNDNCQVKITKFDCVLYHGDNWSNINKSYIEKNGMNEDFSV